MLYRLVAALLVPLCAFVVGVPASAQPAAASPARPAAAAANPWPYPKVCLETEQLAFQQWRDLDTQSQYLDVVGATRPCAKNKKAQPGVRVALSQYGVVGSSYAGWMGDPWRANSIGQTKFRRVGTIPGIDTTWCFDTGLIVRPGGLYGEHSLCFRAEWGGPKGTIGQLTEVDVDDERVSVPLERVPAPGANAPTGCWNCLVTSTKPMPVPEPMPFPATVVPKCTRLNIDDIGTDKVGGIALAGSIRSCAPGQTDKLYIAAVYYGPDGGRLGAQWKIEEPNLYKFDRSTRLGDDENALCLTSGRFQTFDGSYAVHLACFASRTDAKGNTRYVQISTHDPRVRKPVDPLDDGIRGGTCATCL
jgi:hypothetical protein